MQEVTAQFIFNIVVVCDELIPNSANLSLNINPKDCNIENIQNCKNCKSKLNIFSN